MSFFSPSPEETDEKKTTHRRQAYVTCLETSEQGFITTVESTPE